MNWLDWLFVVIIIVSGWQGLRKGLISSISRLLGIIVGLAVAFTGYRSLANYFDLQLGWGSSISAFFLERLPLPLLEQFNQKVSFFDLLLSPFNKQSVKPDYQLDLPGNILTLVNHLTTSLLEVLAFVVLLIATSIIISSILRIISGAVAKTFLSPLDRVGGFTVGLVRGVLIILILVMLTRPFSIVGNAAISGKQSFINKGITGSKLLPYTNEYLNKLKLSVPAWPLPYSSFKQI